jgi:hypothetical protein
MQLKSNTIEVSELMQSQKDRMFELMNCYYENSHRGDFDKDLSEKNYVILLQPECSSEIIGFSTVKHFIHPNGSEDYGVVFSGDTIIDKAYWGSLVLPVAFGKLLFSIKEQNPGKKLYWMLISKGVRTFKYLTTFFNEYYPCYREETPTIIEELMNSLGARKFPDSYNSENGIIEANSHSQYLKDEFQGNPSNKIKPEIKFFFDKNPGYYKGDELLCLAEYSKENLKPFITRILEKR